MPIDSLVIIVPTMLHNLIKFANQMALKLSASWLVDRFAYGMVSSTPTLQSLSGVATPHNFPQCGRATIVEVLEYALLGFLRLNRISYAKVSIGDWH